MLLYAQKFYFTLEIFVLGQREIKCNDSFCDMFGIHGRRCSQTCSTVIIQFHVVYAVTSNESFKWFE